MKLRGWNFGAGLFYIVQGLVYYTLTRGSMYDIYIQSLSQDRFGGTLTPSLGQPIFTIDLGLVLGVLLTVTGIYHITMATFFEGRYQKYIERGQNPYRWYEYSVSFGLLIVAVGLISGIQDLPTLILMFILVAGWAWFSLTMEKENQLTGQGVLIYRNINWKPFWWGNLMLLGPWIAVFMAMLSARAEFGSQFPSIVLAATAIAFVFLMSFPVNMYLQFKEYGYWDDYVFGEKMYVVLALTAKTVVEWIIFTGVIGGV